jgi:hypothetical protein
MADIQGYCRTMASLPSKRSVRALAVGLALGGAAICGPAPLDGSTGYASALAGMPAFEEPPPPPPDPVPIIDKDTPADPGPINASPQPHHRRHHGDPVMGR